MNRKDGISWALNSATIMNSDWEEELTLWQEFGWREAEIWYSRVESQLALGRTAERLGQQMRDAGVEPIGMCGGVLLTSGAENEDVEGNAGPNFLKRLDTAAAMQVPSLTAIILGSVGDDLAEEYKRLIPKLHWAAEAAAERNLRINLEFLGGYAVNGTLGSCIELIKQVDHPSLGMLFDFCHYYVSPSHIEEMTHLSSEKLFLVHVDDVRPLPMETVKNDQRCFPGEGRMDVTGMINHLHNVVGYRGPYCVELYDEDVWKMEPHAVLSRLADCLNSIEEKLELSSAPDVAHPQLVQA